MNTNQEYVWYVGYGSNLNKQRFLCYILGGTPKYGCKPNEGCINKTLPPEVRSDLYSISWTHRKSAIIIT